MTTENQLLDEAFDDFDFEKPPEATELDGENTFWGQLWVSPPIKCYPKKADEGGIFEIPGVYNDLYDRDTKTSSRQGLYQFKGLAKSKSSKHTVHILVLQMENAQGQSYHRRPLVIKSFKGQNDEVNELLEKQWPALEAIDMAGRNLIKIASKQPNNSQVWPYVRVTETITGNSWISNTTGNEIKNKYYADIQVFPNREEWQKAKDEFYTPRDNGTQVSVNSSRHYPVAWEGEVDEWLSGLNNALKGNMSKQVAVASFGLTGLDMDGNPVDADRIINEARNLTAF